MSLATALAQIQRPSWWDEPPPPWASNNARNARYATEREAVHAAIQRAQRISYEELRAETKLCARALQLHPPARSRRQSLHLPLARSQVRRGGAVSARPNE